VRIRAPLIRTYVSANRVPFLNVFVVVGDTTQLGKLFNILTSLLAKIIFNDHILNKSEPLFSFYFIKSSVLEVD